MLGKLIRMVLVFGMLGATHQINRQELPIGKVLTHYTILLELLIHMVSKWLLGLEAPLCRILEVSGGLLRLPLGIKCGMKPTMGLGLD